MSGLVSSYVQQAADLDQPNTILRLKKATQQILFADGRQWIDWNKRNRTWQSVPNPHGRVRGTFNLVLPILRARIARMLSGEVNWDVSAATNALDDRDRAKIAEFLLPQHWRQSQMNAKLRLGMWLALTTGMSFLKQFWNPTIGPSQPATLQVQGPGGQVFEIFADARGQPVLDDNGEPVVNPNDPRVFHFKPGDVDTALRSVFNIKVNPEATGWTRAEGFRWLIDEDIVPISVVKERYGEVAKNVNMVDGASQQLRTFRQLIRSTTQRSGFAIDVGGTSGTSKSLVNTDMTVLREYWEDRSEQLPEGRLIVTAGNVLIHDGKLPQGIVPYVPLFDERRPFDPWGRAVTIDLVPPQKVINQEISLVLEEMQAHGVGQWFAFDFPGIPDRITNESNAIIKFPMRASLQGKSLSNMVQRVDSGRAPTDRWRLVEVSRNMMFTIGAFNEISRGDVPGRVDSATAIQLLQESEAMQFEDAIEGLKGSLLLWAEQRLVIAKWGYGEDESRYLPMGREDLDFMVDSFNGADLPDDNNVTIDLKGFRPQSKAALRQEVRELMTNGVLPPEVGLRLLDLGRGVKGFFESENRQMIRARRVVRAIEKGEFEVTSRPEDTSKVMLMTLDGEPMLNSFDDGAIHLEILQELILDDTKPAPIREAAMLHAATIQDRDAERAAQQLQAELEVVARKAQAEATGKVVVEEVKTDGDVEVAKIKQAQTERT